VKEGPIQMNVAIPIWEGKVSPVFDTASRLLVLQVTGEHETSRYETVMDRQDVTRKCTQVQELGVDILICGAISWHFRRVLGASGIEVIPWISGPAEEVLEAFRNGVLMDSKYLMPGCNGAGSNWKGEMGMPKGPIDKDKRNSTAR
jgi:predicted Fe-Mo cluster-binding NifX family protein